MNDSILSPTDVGLYSFRAIRSERPRRRFGSRTPATVNPHPHCDRRSPSRLFRHGSPGNLKAPAPSACSTLFPCISVNSTPPQSSSIWIGWTPTSPGCSNIWASTAWPTGRMLDPQDSGHRPPASCGRRSRHHLPEDRRGRGHGRSRPDRHLSALQHPGPIKAGAPDAAGRPGSRERHRRFGRGGPRAVAGRPSRRPHPDPPGGMRHRRRPLRRPIARRRRQPGPVDCRPARPAFRRRDDLPQFGSAGCVCPRDTRAVGRRRHCHRAGERRRLGRHVGRPTPTRN